MRKFLAGALFGLSMLAGGISVQAAGVTGESSDIKSLSVGSGTLSAGDSQKVTIGLDSSIQADEALLEVYNETIDYKSVYYATANEAGQLEFDFEIPEEGTYSITGLKLVDDGNTYEYSLSDLGLTQEFCASVDTDDDTYDDDEILNLAFDSESLEKITNEFYRIFTVLYKDKRKREIKYKDKKNREIEYKNCFKNKDLKDRLINGLKIKDSNKEKYLEILKIKDGKENGLNKIYKYICDNEKLDAKDIITSLSGLSDKDVDVDIKNKLKNILVVENFLVEINNLFYEILNCKKINNLINACDSNDSDDKEVNNSIEDIKKMTEKLKSIYEELKSNFKNKNEKNLICSSYKKTCEELDNIKFEKVENTEITACDIKNIIYSIIEDHVNLQNKSHKKSWIEKDSNGNIKIKHKVEHKYNDRWEHDYYISTIKNIVGSMKEWN